MKPKILRMREVRRLREQLEDIGLGPHVAAVEELLALFDAYVSDGRARNGAIPLPSGTGRSIVYDLPDKTDQVCSVLLKRVE